MICPIDNKKCDIYSGTLSPRCVCRHISSHCNGHILPKFHQMFRIVTNGKYYVIEKLVTTKREVVVPLLNWCMFKKHQVWRKVVSKKFSQNQTDSPYPYCTYAKYRDAVTALNAMAHVEQTDELGWSVIPCSV